MRRTHRRVHGLVWLLLAPVLAGLLFLVLSNRIEPPIDAVPEALPGARTE